VGESGSGKSVTALSVLKLLPYPAAQPPVRHRDPVQGRGSSGQREEPTCAEVRGNDITMIFQEPMTSLNPLQTVERQIGEILHCISSFRDEARKQVLELLDQVGIRDAGSASGPIRTSCRAGSGSA
jgi:microcin C transport system ATP-binding protein